MKKRKINNSILLVPDATIGDYFVFGKGSYKMGKIYKSMSELVGNTPMLRLYNLEKELDLKGHILAKLEMFNPAGSIKDRVAKAMILDAIAAGKLKKDSVIIEPTSGNTGIGLAAVAASMGYRAMIIMPDTMSMERRQLVKAYGAELVLTEGSKGMKGAIEKAEELQKELPGSLIAGQFVNPVNPMAHYDTTGPEIEKDTEGLVDYFIAGVGTGGTISGTGKYLKEHIKGIRVVAVEPKDSPILSGGKAGPHKLQGIGAGFIPETLDTESYDDVITVEHEDAYKAARIMGSREGILIGISGGAALSAAIKLAKETENENKNIVVIIPDTGDRYLSTELYQ